MNKKLRSAVALVLVSLFLLTGCAGRAANPIMVHQFGDDKKSCRAIELELSQIQQEIARLLPDTEKTGTNVALGVTGVFLLIPLFFMDFTESEKIEVNAFRQRYNHLVIVATDKNCGFEAPKMPELKKPEPEKPDPTLEDMGIE